MQILQNNYRSMKTVCPHCKSVLQLTAKDIGGGDVCEYFYKCAACGQTVQLTAIPRPVLEELENDPS